MENADASNNVATKEDTMSKYLAQLNEQQVQAFELAKNHLRTSFNLRQSNGYKEWLKKEKTKY